MRPEPNLADPLSLPGRVWRVLGVTVRKYIETDGELRAASFAYYAFFALFPLVLLFISLGALVWDEHEVASRLFTVLDDYIPVGPFEQNVINSTLQGVVASRSQAGMVAVLALAWSALRFFQALMHGINRAWGTREYTWWRLPLANLTMVAIMASTLLLGVLLPVVMKAIEARWLATAAGKLGLTRLLLADARLVGPSCVLFYGLLMLYKYAPRRKTTVREVWLPALLVTLGLQLVARGFVFYAANFGRFNAVYGTLGSVVAVLMWIYLSGSVLIFGGCLCAAMAEVAAAFPAARARRDLPPG